MDAQPAPAGRLAVAAALLGAALAALWWPEPAPQPVPQPVPAAGTPAAPVLPGALPPRPVPAPPVPSAAADTTVPQVKMAPHGAGRDPLAAAVEAARAAPAAPPPPGIGQAASLEQAFAAMQAARGEAPPAAVAASPFGRP